MGNVDVRTAAQMEYRERMKQRLEDAPLPLEILMMSPEPITQKQLDNINQAVQYENREKIPEVLLPFADLYHELTGQEPTKRSYTDWINTFWIWKDEKLSPDDITMAWNEAQTRFTVGRPGALTVTAVGCKSKSKPAKPAFNTAEIERTAAIIEERKAQEVKFVPRPANVLKPNFGKQE